MGGSHSKKHSNQEKQMAKLKRAFLMFDKNEDGEISIEELGKVMKFLELNPKEHELKQMIQKADLDGNGTVNFEEFLVMMRSHPPRINQEQEMRQLFRTFDKRHKGVITKQDIKAVMAELGEDLTDEEVDEMFCEVDTNRSGVIDYKKFTTMVKKLLYS